MPWQDWVFSIGALILAAALIPSVRSKEKPPISTSLPIGSILIIFSLTYLTLSLSLSLVFGRNYGSNWPNLANIIRSKT